MGDNPPAASGIARFPVLMLWGLGVGAVISGDFFGWNIGLDRGGFGGMIAAMVIVVMLYIGLCFCQAEMAAAMPSDEGVYAFALRAFGPWGGYLIGLAVALEYVILPATIVTGMGGFMEQLLDTPNWVQPFYWFIFYCVFLTVNIRGAGASLGLSFFVTVVSISVLAVMWLGSGYMMADDGWDTTKGHLTSIPEDDDKWGHSEWMPFGYEGIIAAIPFAAWFFLAVDELPIAAEDCPDATRNVPKAIVVSLATLTVCAFLTAFTNTGIAPGAVGLRDSGEPLLEAFTTIMGSGIGDIFPIIALIGMATSFHAIMYAYGSQLYALSKAGAFPELFGRLHAKNKTPYMALLLGAGFGFVVCFGAFTMGDISDSVDTLVSLSVFVTLIAYMIETVAFIELRRNHKTMDRPYWSPFGNAGAVVAFVISFITFFYMVFWDSDNFIALYLLLAAYALGILYFALVSKKRVEAKLDQDAAAKKEEGLEEGKGQLKETEVPVVPHDDSEEMGEIATMVDDRSDDVTVLAEEEEEKVEEEGEKVEEEKVEEEKVEEKKVEEEKMEEEKEEDKNQV